MKTFWRDALVTRASVKTARQIFYLALLAALAGCGSESDESSGIAAATRVSATTGGVATTRASATSAPATTSASAATGATGRPSVPLAGSTSTAPSVTTDSSSSTTTTGVPAPALIAQQTAANTLTVSWLAPTENTDGSALTNLHGYRIYYGTSKTDMSHKIDINTVGTQSFVVEDLAPGVWYFAVSAYNSKDIESTLSNVADGTI